MPGAALAAMSALSRCPLDTPEPAAYIEARFSHERDTGAEVLDGWMVPCGPFEKWIAERVGTVAFVVNYAAMSVFPSGSADRWVLMAVGWIIGSAATLLALEKNQEYR